MIRRVLVALVALAFGVVVLPACAAQPFVTTTTTTSGVVKRARAACLSIEASCSRDLDCCSLLCVSGLCEGGEP
jgi:hypothetical protein